MIQAAANSVQNSSDPSVNPIGLTSAEVSRRFGEIGPNTVSEEAPPRWRRFLAKFSAPIAWMLEAAIVLQIGLGAYVEAAVIGGLLLFNATLGFIQEGRAAAALAALKMRLAPTALSAATANGSSFQRRNWCLAMSSALPLGPWCPPMRASCPARSWWINPCSPGNPFRSMQIPAIHSIQARWCAAARRLPKLRQQDPEPILGAPPNSCARPVPPALSSPPS